MSARTSVTSIFALAISLSGCRKDETPAAAVAPAGPVPGLTTVEVAVAGPAQTPNLGVGEDGLVTLSWQEAAGKDTLVRWKTRSATAGWGEAATVTRGAKLVVNWADFPAMQSTGPDTYIATWLRILDSEDGYGAQWSRTVDGGKTWTEAQFLHESTAGPEFGFVSMTPLPGRATAVYWLDGRASGGHGESGGAMQLRGAEVAADGTISGRRLIDDRICDCCQTSAATTPSGPVVVYRDRSTAEVRDISIAGPAPDQRRTVADDGWTIAGCPVNGPAVASNADQLVVAWFTGVTDAGSVRVAFAKLKGAFSAPVMVDLGSPMGRVDVEWLDDDRALVSFIDRTGSPEAQANLLARVVSRSGELGAPLRVAQVAASNATGFPRIAKTGDQIVWAWTDIVDGAPTIRVAEAPIAGLLAG